MFWIYLFGGLAIWQFFGVRKALRWRKKRDEDFKLRREKPRILEHADVIGQEMIEGAAGRNEELQDNIIAAIEAKGIPHTLTQKLSGGYGNIPRMILSIENPYDTYWRWLLVGLDYGSFLDVRWFRFYEKRERIPYSRYTYIGGMITGWMDKKYEEGMSKLLDWDGGHEYGQSNVEHWREMIELVVRDEIQKMRGEEPITDFHKQVRDAKGFINLSHDGESV